MILKLSKCFLSALYNAMQNVRVWGKKEMENCNDWQLWGDAYVPVLLSYTESECKRNFYSASPFQ